MHLRLHELRQQIRQCLREFGVDDDNRYSAGYFMAGGISNQHRDRENAIMSPPPGLGDGDTKEDVDDNDDPTGWNQPGARATERAGGPYGATPIKKH